MCGSKVRHLRTWPQRFGQLIEGPALRTMVAGGGRPIERTFALASVEAAEMPTRERGPEHAVGVNVPATWSESCRGHLIELRDCSSGRIIARPQKTRLLASFHTLCI